MNIKNNINYFKRGDGLRIFGMCLMVPGVLGLWLGWSYSYYLYLISTIALPVGFVCFLLSSIGRSSEEDIDACVQRIGLDIERDIEKHPKQEKKVLAHIPPVTAEGYLYHDGLMFTRGKDGTVRSTEYTRAMVYVLSDALFITRRTGSLISEGIREDAVEIPFTMLEKAEIVTEEKTVTFGKKSFHVKETRLHVTYGDCMVFSTPIHNDITADQFAETINKTARAYLKEKCEGQSE